MSSKEQKLYRLPLVYDNTKRFIVDTSGDESRGALEIWSCDLFRRLWQDQFLCGETAGIRLQ